MADIEFKLSGADELLKRMRALPVELRQRPARAALGKAAKLIRDRAAQNALGLDDPATGEQIAKNIATRFSPSYQRKTGDLKVRVGVLGGASQYANTRENVRKGRVGQTYELGGDKSNPGGDTWYWRFLEFGTEKSKAQPFMRPAAEQEGQAAIDLFASELDKAITKLLKKLK